MKLFVILDPTLASYGGHSLHYDSAVGLAARRCGFEVVTAARWGCPAMLSADFRIEPRFRGEFETSWVPHLLTRRSSILRRLDLALRGAVFARDLRRAGCLSRCDSSTIVFAPNVTPAHVSSLVRWLESIDRRRRPALLIMLRYAPAANPFRPRCASAADYARALGRLERSPARKRIFLFTDSELLQEEYAQCTTLPISLVPIPHTRSCEAPAATLAAPRPRVLTFLGPARAAKGFPLLPFAVRQLQPRLASGEWQAEFQAHVASGHEVECLWARDELRGLSVTLFERELTVPEYWQMLGRSSLVLVPYQLEYYHAQTSGILCEALAAGKPVVVPKGTWMARQIASRGVGRTFIPGDRLSLIDAVEAAMQTIDDHAAAARRLAPQWMEYHNPDSFFNTLTAGLAA